MIIGSLLSFCTYGQLALQDFEAAWTGTPAAPPGGWVVYNEVGTVTWARSIAGNAAQVPFAGSHAAFLNLENVVPSAPTPSNWLITPQFNAPNNGLLHFYSRLTKPGDQGGVYKIMIAPVADPTTPVTSLPFVEMIPTLTELALNPTQTEYVEKTFNVPAAYTGMQIRIAFVMQGDDKDRWLIDNVEVVSQCDPPATLSANNTTLTSAELSWVSPAGVTQWEIEVVEELASPTGTGVSYSGPLPYVKQGLSANGDYKFYVRSVCTDGGKSLWIGPFYFKTPAIGERCADPLVIPSGLPYSTTNNTTNFGDYYEGIPGTGCNATGNYLAGNDVVYSYTPTANGTIHITLSNTGGAAGMFIYSSCANIGVNCINGVTASATAAGVIPSLPVVAGTTYYIVISTNNTPLVTDYTLTLQQVFCASPTGLTASGQTFNSANLSWAAGTATSWQIAVQNPGAGVPTVPGQNVTQNTNLNVTQTLAGAAFTPATNYEYYVRANCGDGTYSIWSGPFAFSTTQVAIGLPFAENFDGPAAHGFSIVNTGQTNKWFVGPATFSSPSNSLFVSNDNGINNNYTVTATSVVHAYRDITFPATITSGQALLSFDIKSGGESTFDYVRVWIVPTSYVPAAGTQTGAGAGRAQLGGNFNLLPNWTTQNIVFNASSYAGTTQRVVFEWRNDNIIGAQPAAAIDNVGMKVVTCPAPTALTLASATQSSATYTWTPPTAVPTGYDYYYSQTNTPPTDATPAMGTVASPSATISPLNTMETYYVWVRSNCGPGNTSFWIGPVSVVVPQAPATLEYNQNFDTGPSDLAIMNGTQTNKWYVGSFVSNSPTTSLYVSNDNGNNNDYSNATASAVHAFRDISIPGSASQIEVKFDIKAGGQAGDYVRVWMVPTIFAPTPGTQITASADRVMLTPTAGLFNIPAWTTFTYDTSVSAFQNQTRRIIFEWRNDAFGGGPLAAAIDNINIKVSTCPKPTALTATNVTSTNATLDWTEAASATNWEVAIMPAASAAVPTGAGTPVATNSEYTPPAGTLVPGTHYVYYVRAMCGGAAGNSIWSGPFQFALKPANDDCAQATVVLTNPDLNCTNFANGNITGATASAEATTCGGTKDDDIWFEFVATHTSHNINLNNITGSTTDLFHVVYSGNNCGALTQLYCSDPNNSVANNLVIGQTYKVRVYSWTSTANQTSAFQLCITTPPPPPVNDPCSGAISVPVNPTLACAQTTPGTIYSATASPEATTCGGTKDDDVWFTFVATNATHRVSLTNITGSTTDLFHVVYSGNNCGALTQLYCSDPNESWANNLIVGQTYYIRVYSWTGTAGQTSAFNVCIGTPPPPPANDECAGAIVAPVNPTMVCEDVVAGTVASATASPQANTCGNVNDDDDVWFQFTATSTAHLIEIKDVVAPTGSGSTTDLYHVVYSGDQCGTLTQMYCSDPNFSIATNLIVGQTYRVRVYTTTATLNQTTTFNLCVSTPPPPVTNDECDTAIVAAVNGTSNCTVVTPGSVYGATASPQANTCGNTNDDDDVWFQFTATSTSLIISLKDVAGSTTDLYHAVYAGDQCGSLTQVVCSDANSSTYASYIVGNVYKVRVYSNASTPQVVNFNLCIRPTNTSITTNTTTYTVQQLVNQILVSSECALVSNITSSSQANFGGEPSIGYFDANGATFPFSYGVVMSSGGVSGVPATPYTGGSTADSGTWPGDTDLNDIIVQSDPNQLAGTRNATILEFDFVPLTNLFKFQFLFASNEYGTFQCGFSDAFAFILTDADGNETNLAVIPGTSTPVSVTTIRELQYLPGGICSSTNPEFFDQYNAEAPLGAAINFIGQTIPMVASSPVVPNTTYHIKLVIADYSDTAFNSAVFLGGGTFDIGELEMGGNLLVSQGNALCAGETAVLDTELNADDYIFTWYKDGALIPDATGPSYTVSESGTYGVEAQFESVACSYEGIVQVEFFPEVELITGDPVDMIVCDATGFSTFDLTPNLDAILAGSTTPADFTNTIHLTEEDAEGGVNPIDAAQYTAYTNVTENQQTLWIRTVSASTTCYGVKSFNLIVEDRTPQYTISGDNGNLSFCDGTSATIDIVLTDTDPNPVTYTWTKDGAPLPDTTPSITVTDAGEYIVVLDRTGCTATSTVNVVVTPIPVADAPADVTVCDSYVLPALSANNNYIRVSDDLPLSAGDIIQSTTEIRVVAESGTTPNCTSENTFTVTINASPAVEAPADVAACDSYVLPALTNAGNNYYTGPGGTGTQLNADDVITSTQTIYVYQETGTTPNCSNEASFTVTISITPEVDAPADVNVCDSYVLPALTVGNYYTGAAGTGVMLSAGEAITTTQLLYVYAETGTTPNCFDENTFTVNVTPTPQFNLGGPYNTCVASNVTINVANPNFDLNTATYTWTLDGAAISGGSSITASGFGTYQLTVTINDCIHTESVTITQDTTLIDVVIIDGCEGGSYMVRAVDDNGSFNIDNVSYLWEGPNGFSSTEREFSAPAAGEYFVTITTPEGCTGENSVIIADTGCNIQRGISPNNDGLNDSFDLSTFDVKKLSIYNRYGQEVYTKNNYVDEWIGQTNKGDELPTGTYFYMVERMNGETNTGWIYINRQE